MSTNTTPAQFSCQKRFFGVKMFIRMCRISKWPVPFFWFTIGQDIQDGVSDFDHYTIMVIFDFHIVYYCNFKNHLCGFYVKGHE